MDTAPLANDLLFGARDIAGFLGVKEQFARRLVASREIPAFKMAGKICARKTALHQWIVDRESRI